MSILDHDNRGESAYPRGRQPFGYSRIIAWAKANCYPYRFARCDKGGIGLLVKGFTPKWVYMRGSIKGRFV